jgi:hypothetical protein
MEAQEVVLHKAPLAGAPRVLEEASHRDKAHLKVVRPVEVLRALAEHQDNKARLVEGAQDNKARLVKGAQDNKARLVEGAQHHKAHLMEGAQHHKAHKEVKFHHLEAHKDLDHHLLEGVDFKLLNHQTLPTLLNLKHLKQRWLP